LLERGRQHLRQLECAPHERKEEREVLARRWSARPEVLDLPDERLDGRVGGGDAEGGWLADGEGAEPRSVRSGEERHDAAVRVADEVVTLPKLGTDLTRLVLEVDPLERRPRWVPAAREEHAVEAVLERTLRRPGHRCVPDAAVHEHDARHLRDAIRCNEVGRISLRKAGSGCYKHVGMLLAG
jgi:hypothetical protein